MNPSAPEVESALVVTGHDSCFVERFSSALCHHSDVHPEYLRIAALWALGVACKNSSGCVRDEEIRGNLYTLLVGPPGASRKSWAIGRTVRVLRMAGIDTTINAISFSTEALADTLVKGDLDLTADEFRQLTSSFSRDYASGTLPMLNTLWGGTPEQLKLILRTKPAIIPRGRFGSILTAATPRWLAGSRRGVGLEELLHSGMISRFLVCWPSSPNHERELDWRTTSDTVEALASELVIREKFSAVVSHIEFTDEAVRISSLIHRRMTVDEEVGSRASALTLRVALLLAISRLSEVVEPEDAESACQIVGECMVASNRLAQLSTHSARVQHAILEALNRSPGRVLSMPELALAARCEQRDADTAIEALRQLESVIITRTGPAVMVKAT